MSFGFYKTFDGRIVELCYYDRNNKLDDSFLNYSGSIQYFILLPVRLLEAEVVTEPVGREPVEHPAEILEPSTSASFSVEDHCLGSTLMLSSSSDTCPSSGSSESFPFYHRVPPFLLLKGSQQDPTWHQTSVKHRIHKGS